MSAELSIRERLPDGLADCPAPELEELLGGPTLLHLPGAAGAPLYLSVLLHGNETTGWDALRGILRDFAGARLPRPMSVLIGNVRAARVGMRRLDDQPDYNRIWDFQGDTPEHRMARRIFEEVRARAPAASIDVHNTTGPNPHYSCVNRLDARSLHLAQRFSAIAVHSEVPASMHSLRFNSICPAITIECGEPDQTEGTVHARAYLEQRLFESALPDRMPDLEGLELFHTVAQVQVPREFSFGFADRGKDLCLSDALVQYNFRELPAKFELGRWGAVDNPRLLVRDRKGRDLFDDYFVNRGDRLATRKPLILSMLTQQEKIIEQDCLCYLMKPLQAPAPSASSRASAPGPSGE